jgi:hypothetical protein
MIMKATWMTIKEVIKESIDAVPGITSVLHTFGSDMKYHIHTHSLVTFGGVDNKGDWIYPTDNYKITKYRKMCSTYKRVFLLLLKEAYQNSKNNIMKITMIFIR